MLERHGSLCVREAKLARVSVNKPERKEVNKREGERGKRKNCEMFVVVLFCASEKVKHALYSEDIFTHKSTAIFGKFYFLCNYEMR